MKKKTLLMVLLALVALTLPSLSCTLMYPGCSKDSECESGEKCIWSPSVGAGECGYIEEYCGEPLSETECENTSGRCEDTSLRQVCGDDGRWRLCAQGTLSCGEGCVLAEASCSGSDCHAADGACVPAGDNPDVSCNAPVLLDDSCDNIDNDCDGNTDEDYVSDLGEKVGETCSVGLGVCESRGQLQCNSSGQILCDAVEGPRQALSCDCEDDDCDGSVDEFLFMLNGETTDNRAQRAPWSTAIVNGRSFAAYPDEATGTNILVVEFTATGIVPIVQFPGKMPQLMPRTNDLALFYVQVSDDGTAIDEVHVRSVDINNNTLGPEICVGCTESERSTFGPVVDYEATWAHCGEDNVTQCNDNRDNDGDGLSDLDDPECAGPGGLSEEGENLNLCNDGIDNDGDALIDAMDGGCDPELALERESNCGYLIAYVRGSKEAFYSTRVYEHNLHVQTNSVGTLLAGGALNRNLTAVDVAMSSWSFSYLLFVSEAADTSTLTLISAPANNRTQYKSHLELANVPLDPTFDLVYADESLLVGWNEGSAMRIEVITPDAETGLVEDSSLLLQSSFGTGEIRNLSLYSLCSNRAMALYEVVNAGASSVELAVFNPSLDGDLDGNIDAPEYQSAISGTLPVLSDEEGELIWGALVAANEDLTVTDSTLVIPRINAITCDSPTVQ